jgi:thymidylate synthase
MVARAFINAQDAFEDLYHEIMRNGVESDGTKFLHNVGFYMYQPMNNKIKTPWRKWKLEYAEREWAWYLSENRSVAEIKKHAKIWDLMHSGDDIVNSNYGYQWNRNGQLDYVINELIRNPQSRRAVVTIYDGKEHQTYEKDSPCTLNVVFNITESRLNMSVLMRSCDLWFGFCNDQYCFSKLQQLVSNRLELQIGWYYHFVNNFHLYERHFNKMSTER